MLLQYVLWVLQERQATTKEGEGNSTYRNRIIDAVYNIDGDTLEAGAKYEIR